MEVAARRALVEALIAFAVATFVVAVLFQLAGVWPVAADYLQPLVAVVFLYIPAAIAWRRGQDLRDYGFTIRPIGKSLAFGLGGPAIVFPLFLIGFVLFYRTVCAPGSPHWMHSLVYSGECSRFLGWRALGHPRAPFDLWKDAFSQLVVVAIPEELFFRGYLLDRLELALPPKRRLLGGGIGAALVLSAVLFALGHVLVDFDPRRLATFFPGLLFGWMRSATGSIAAGATAHASANLYIAILHRTFFR
jgi:membrane protease YdiL (CAAX protease family)